MAYIVIVFIALLLIYLHFENKNCFKIATALKVIVSAYIAGIAWYYTISTDKNIYTILISIGLTCAVPADYFLQYIKSNSKKYKAGIICFAGMHLFLLISYYLKYGFNILDSILVTIILIALTVVQTSQKWDLGKEKIFLSIYTFFVALMSAKAMSIALTIEETHAILIGLGGLFFIASDFILGIWDYHNNSEKLVLANRFVYFIGQLLFAISLYFQF